MKQIDLKDYKSKFANCRLPIVKVGVNFDSERRTIGEWKVGGTGDRSVSYPFFSGYGRDEVFPQDTDLSVCHEAHIYI